MDVQLECRLVHDFIQTNLLKWANKKIRNAFNSISLDLLRRTSRCSKGGYSPTTVVAIGSKKGGNLLGMRILW